MMAADPFLYLGYGVNAYFSLMGHFFNMFFWITIFLIPVFKMYTSNPINALRDETQLFRIAKVTLGNLGGASVQCSNVPLAVDKMELACPHGHNIDYKNVQFGVMNRDLPTQDYCLESVITKETPGAKAVCSEYINNESKTFIDL